MDKYLFLRIERYLADKLSDKEKIELEKEIAENPNLQKEISLSKQINLHISNNIDNERIYENSFSKELKRTLHNKEIKSLEKKLLNIKSEYHNKNIRNLFPKRFLLIASSIAILVIGTISLFLFNNTSSKNFYSTYYNTNDLPKIIKRGNNYDFYEKGIIAFNNKKYQEAILNFENYLSSTDFNPSVYIYIGMANCELNKYEKAIIALNHLISSNSIDKPKGLWFKALVYLKQRNNKEAKTILVELQNNPSKYKRKQVESLLKAINSKS